jgi:hypothetical protein
MVAAANQWSTIAGQLQPYAVLRSKTPSGQPLILRDL